MGMKKTKRVGLWFGVAINFIPKQGFIAIPVKVSI